MLRCGDGILTAPEQCDDGNAAPGDGCSPFCLKEKGGLPSILQAELPTSLRPAGPDTPLTDSGPAALSIMAAGAAAGFGFMRRRKGKNGLDA